MMAPFLSDFKIMFLLMPTFSFREVHKSLIKKIVASGLKLFSVGDEVFSLTRSSPIVDKSCFRRHNNNIEDISVCSAAFCNNDCGIL